jgi:hypothetical protein
MIVICGWCKEYQGEKEPLDDLEFTTTICESCSEELLKEEDLSVIVQDADIPWFLRPQAI